MGSFSWTLSIQATGQSPISVSQAAQAVEALDRIVVSLAPGDTDKVVNIQPGSAAAIALLLVKSDRYGSDFSFTASDGSTDSSPVTLDAAQIYTNGSVALFGMDPQQLKLTNSSTDQTAEIEIFVARDATP
jgi:hypothetical protein